VWSSPTRPPPPPDAASPTESYEQIYEKAEIKTHLVDAERRLGPASGAYGAAVFTANGLSGIDLFHSPALFAREWPKLLRAHAVEAFRQAPLSAWAEATLRGRAEDLLAKAARTEGTLRGNAGVGQLFEFRLDRAQGAALTFEGRAVHTAIL
jgi:hypothetical protein